MSDPETLAVYDAQADDYVAMMKDYAAKDPLIAEFIAACPEGGYVLDLGSGPGGYAVLMAEAGLSVDALDASAEMIARIDSPGVSPRVGTFDDVTAIAVYDGIWASFSLLHAPRADMPRHLAALHRAARPGAPFFLGLKRGTGGDRDALGRYYEYYEREDLDPLLEAAGFTPGRHWTGVATGMAGHEQGWIVIEAHA
ncbi:MAG: class I SAM-dependent methyltransferase [Paracoccaceae bacterium]|nr:class I SAM-dependent methyltransferase [Paracoccaceae bacterium]